MTIEQELQEVERKAWASLSRYKFVMFGYWAGVWVHLNRVAVAQGHKRLPNPFGELVKVARRKRG